MTSKFDLHKNVFIIAKVLLLVTLIYIRKISEGQTIAYLGMVIESLFIIILILSTQIIRTITLNQRFISKKYSEYRGFLTYFRNCKSLLFIVIFGSILQIIFASFYSNWVLHTSQIVSLFIISGFILLFLIGCFILLQYFHSMRFYVPILICIGGWSICTLIGSMFIFPLFDAYGIKVSNLLQNDNYTSIYRSIAVLLIVLVTTIFTFIINITFYFIKGKLLLQQKKSKELDGTRAPKTNSSKIIQLGLRASTIELFFHMLVFVGIVMYQTLSDSSDLYALGEYFIVFEIFVGLLLAISSAALDFFEVNTVSYLKNQNIKEVRKEAAYGMRWCIYISILYTSLFIVLSKYLKNILLAEFGADDQIFIIAALTIPFLLLGTYFAKLNNRLKLEKFVSLGIFISLLVYLILVALLFKINGTTIESLGYAKLITSIFFFIFNFIVFDKKYSIVLSYVSQLLLPLIVGIISGGIVYFLNGAWDIYLNDIIVIALNIMLIPFFYFIGIISLKSLKKEEILYMPGGKTIKKIASILHLF